MLKTVDYIVTGIGGGLIFAACVHILATTVKVWWLRRRAGRR